MSREQLVRHSNKKKFKVCLTKQTREQTNKQKQKSFPLPIIRFVCFSIFFSFSWDGSTQEKLETMVMQGVFWVM